MTEDFLAVVRAQPEILARSIATVRAALADPRVPAMLGTGRLLALGMGASAHAAAGFAAVLRAAGRPAFAASASDVAGPPGLADAYLAISHSGRSRETVEGVRALGGPNRVGLTSSLESPLAEAVDTVLPLGCDTDTRVSTASYTATLAALGLVAEALGAPGPGPWDALPELAAVILGDDVESTVDVLSGVSTVDVIGAGPALASAGAAALLLREAVHLPATAYSTREYLHGALEVAGPGRGALVFHNPRLASDLFRYGASVVHVTDFVGERSGGSGRYGVLNVIQPPGLAGCVLDILPVQLMAYRLAERRGIPIELRHMPADTKLSGCGQSRRTN
jgi:glucosamine--fructose-6-phosphate aminotransferase (isomerizing)